MKRILFITLLLIVFSSFGFSQMIKAKSEIIEISICRPEITEEGRKSDFQFNYVYSATTNEKGLIGEIKEISDRKKFDSFVNNEAVIPCIKKWKLKSSEIYIITIEVGTTGDRFLFISNKKDKIQILL